MMSRKLILLALATSSVLITTAHALELGLEASARVEASDNVSGGVVGTEDEGQIGFGLLGVFGEQRGTAFQAGFSGELETRQVLDSGDGDPTTLNSFFGAANVTLSRSLSWYFGNVLGTVQTSDQLLTFEDEDTTRRNVFVTGPTLNINIDSLREVNAELLYFNQNQDDRELAQLWTARIDFRQTTDRGNTFGVNIDNIFSDEPSEELADGFAGGLVDREEDSNRLSASVFWERDRGLLNWFLSGGGTRFDTNDETINGVNAEFRLTRRLGPTTDLIFSIGTDLVDENISSIDTLLQDGSGIEAEADGVFQSNSASLVYSFSGSRTSYETGLRVAGTQFELVDTLGIQDDAELDDNVTVSVFGVLSRALTTRLDLELGIEFENQDFNNLDDDSNSIRANALLSFQLTRSFDISAGLRTARSEGINTRDNISLAADGSFETIENRVLAQLRWTPPSRASQEPVIQLKQLLN